MFHNIQWRSNFCTGKSSLVTRPYGGPICLSAPPRNSAAQRTVHAPSVPLPPSGRRPGHRLIRCSTPAAPNHRVVWSAYKVKPVRGFVFVPSQRPPLGSLRLRSGSLSQFQTPRSGRFFSSIAKCPSPRPQPPAISCFHVRFRL